jgi:protein TonB
VSASRATGKTQSRNRAGTKGTGEKGQGRLTKGSGSGNVAPSDPRLLTQTAPDYPASARRRGAHGVAWVRVQVSSIGSVADASLYRSCGHSDLDSAAVRTAKRWRFAPAVAGGSPVSAAAVVKVAFVLGR